MVIKIGTSGWSYDHWEPELYPAGLPPRDRLARYAAAFDTAELNASFYRWPRPAAFGSWQRRLPDGFCLSVKAPRGLTHGRRLYGPEPWVPRLESGWHELGDKRAVLLVQLAPGHQRDDARLAYFLRLFPGWIRVAVEFRHPSWHCEDVFALLAAHGAAYCVMSGANLPCVLRVTADFVYIRLLGDRKGIEQKTKVWEKVIVDRSRELMSWVNVCQRAVRRGVSTYVYVNNHYAGFAPGTIEQFQKLWKAAD